MHYHLHDDWTVITTELPIEEDSDLDLETRWQFEDKSEALKYLEDPAVFSRENGICEEGYHTDVWDVPAHLFNDGIDDCDHTPLHPYCGCDTCSDRRAIQ